MKWGNLGKPNSDLREDVRGADDNYACSHCGKKFEFESSAMMHLRNCEKRPARQGKIMRSEVKDLK